MTFLNFFKLSGDEQRILLKTLFLMVKIRLMLWLMSFPRIQRSFKYIKPTATDKAAVTNLIWSVKVVSHYVPRSTCLTNALTGYSLFSLYGYPSQVKIGVGKSSEGEFEAHAWLEYNDEVVIGESEKEYVPLLDFKRG